MAPIHQVIGLLINLDRFTYVNWLWNFYSKVLGPNGRFVVKVFQGAGFDEFRKQVVDSFDVLKTAKPAASQARSKEVFGWTRA